MTALQLALSNLISRPPKPLGVKTLVMWNDDDEPVVEGVRVPYSKMVIIGQCKHCGNDYRRTGGCQSYCSSQCQSRARELRRKERANAASA